MERGAADAGSGSASSTVASSALGVVVLQAFFGGDAEYLQQPGATASSTSLLELGEVSSASPPSRAHDQVVDGPDRWQRHPALDGTT